MAYNVEIDSRLPVRHLTRLVDHRLQLSSLVPILLVLTQLPGMCVSPGVGYGRRMAEETTTCPICGEGTLVDLAFDGRADDEALRQAPDSRERQTYDCGHEVLGLALRSADADALDVERRSSKDTVEPLAEQEPSDDPAQ